MRKLPLILAFLWLLSVQASAAQLIPANGGSVAKLCYQSLLAHISATHKNKKLLSEFRCEFIDSGVS